MSSDSPAVPPTPTTRRVLLGIVVLALVAAGLAASGIEDRAKKSAGGCGLDRRADHPDGQDRSARTRIGRSRISSVPGATSPPSTRARSSPAPAGTSRAGTKTLARA